MGKSCLPKIKLFQTFPHRKFFKNKNSIRARARVKVREENVKLKVKNQKPSWQEPVKVRGNSSWSHDWMSRLSNPITDYSRFLSSVEGNSAKGRFQESAKERNISDQHFSPSRNAWTRQLWHFCQSPDLWSSVMALHFGKRLSWAHHTCHRYHTFVTCTLYETAVNYVTLKLD